MATSMTPPLNGELWHLSIDDLLGPLPDTFRLGGSGPFVINLRASSMSMNPIPHVLQGFDDVHLYQIQRIEDDVLRFRLRLGPFPSEESADAVLLKVRDSYPCALTATAGADDLQAIELLQKPKAPLSHLTAVRASVTVALATPAPAPAPVTVTAPSIVSPPPALVSAAAAKVAPRNVLATTPATLAPTPSLAQVQAKPAIIATPAAVVKVTPPVVAAPPQKQLVPPSQPRATPFENTATVRRLTSAELTAAQSLRWFVIELSMTDHAVDPETVPNLDIYDLYRLYSVTELIEGRRVHALRLGFFGEEMAAKAVAAYLAGYYDNPTIKRVSVAERERFSQQGIEARKDVGATGMHAVIEITGDRLARPVRKSATPPP